MHALHTIQTLNAETFAPAIENYRAQGRYVVATYTGLHIASIETFTDAKEAVALFEAPVESPDVHRKIYTPTAERTPRDQSEDRTLADYIARKQVGVFATDENGCDRN